ncbi:outer membrane homotrimeric porin [Fundidesulfovibrio butyratiphilus]
MKRCLLGLVVLGLMIGLGVQAKAESRVRMVGDARIHATYFQNVNYTGWNYNGTRTIDDFLIWERFRLRTDFFANENLKFRLGIRVNNRIWGSNTFTVDNPTPCLDVYQAFLQFKWPNTEAEFTVGLINFDLPLSNSIFNANPVIGTRSTVAMVTMPLLDKTLGLNAGFVRWLDTNALFAANTTPSSDTLDGYFLALPVTLDGFKATPWGVLGVAGRGAGYWNTPVGSYPNVNNENLLTNLMSAGYGATPNGLRDNVNLYYWVGSSFSVTALDPFHFYADVIYGGGNDSDRSKNRRHGYFIDAAVEYVGLEAVTPQLSFWYGSGEDSSTVNGSERMPVVANFWGPSNSFLFDSSQAYQLNSMTLNAMGSWGFVAALNKISLIKDNLSRVTVSYAMGNNSRQAVRAGNLIWGANTFFQMGRDLAQGDSVVAIGLDHQYNIYENLALIVETGWAHGTFQQSVWGRRFTHEASKSDAVKVSFGFQYKF